MEGKDQFNIGRDSNPARFVRFLRKTTGGVEWHIIIGNDVVRGEGDTDNETDDECNELHHRLVLRVTVGDVFKSNCLDSKCYAHTIVVAQSGWHTDLVQTWAI